MIKKLKNFMLELRNLQQVNVALAKGANMKATRRIDLTRPETWEFSGFSQNGEDGVIDVLRGQLLDENRYVIEIGAADGMQNNSSWPVIAEMCDGLMIDGDARLIERARRTLAPYNIGADFVQMFVNKSNITALKEMAQSLDPDVFSLDIDGNDYFIAKKVLEDGFRPKIWVVEYNSAFGPERSQTIVYQEAFNFNNAHWSRLYYGVSIAGWRKLFDQFEYQFVTVDNKGVNAFFVDPAFFNSEFLGSIQGANFKENVFQRRKFRNTFGGQFALIKDQDFTEI